LFVYEGEELGRVEAGWQWRRRIVERTKACIRLYLFLRYTFGLRYADTLSANGLKSLLNILKSYIISLKVSKDRYRSYGLLRMKKSAIWRGMCARGTAT